MRVRMVIGRGDGLLIVLALKVDGPSDVVAIVEKIQSIITHAAPRRLR